MEHKVGQSQMRMQTENRVSAMSQIKTNQFQLVSAMSQIKTNQFQLISHFYFLFIYTPIQTDVYILI